MKITKRLLSLLLAAALLAGATGALAEQQTHTLEGFVTELLDDGFIMEDVELGKVMLNTDEMTVWDGILADEALEVGQYVFVEYDGKLTRSIPPQAHADKVGCYVLKGTAGDFLQDGVLLTGDEIFGDVIVRFDASRWHVFAGVPMTVYYNGVMALSLPGQVNASAILLPLVEGVVTEKDENGFTVTTDDEQSCYVELDENTLVSVAPQSVEADDEAEGEADEPTEKAEPSIADTDWVIDLDGDENAPEDEAETAPKLGLEDVNAGDRVRVYYGGEYLSDEEDAVLALEVVIVK